MEHGSDAKPALFEGRAACEPARVDESEKQRRRAGRAAKYGAMAGPPTWQSDDSDEPAGDRVLSGHGNGSAAPAGQKAASGHSDDGAPGGP